MKNLLYTLAIFSSMIFFLSCSGDGGISDVEPVMHEVIITVTPSGTGSISPSAESSYEEGNELTLQAEPTQGYLFSDWSGDIEATENPITITVDSAINITATFKESPFAGGEGTESSPFQIATVEQLQAVGGYPTSHFIQINDIDASDTKNWNDGLGFTPIGGHAPALEFAGSYDGQGYSVKNLMIDRKNKSSQVSSFNVALFGKVESSMIKNLVLEQVNISGSVWVGGLIGSSQRSTITNCIVTGWIDAAAGPGGGLVGLIEAETEIRDSKSEVQVSGAGDLGGLVGSNEGYIYNSSSSGDASGAGILGGLVGSNKGGEIQNSFAIGDVSGAHQTGGLVGTFETGRINNSYSLGNVTTTDSYAGGLVGRIKSWNGQISHSYAAGGVTGDTYTGGLIGDSRDILVSCYWDIESTGQDNGVGDGNSEGTVGLTTSEMTGSAAETHMADLDFVETWITTDSYPVLVWE